MLKPNAIIIDFDGVTATSKFYFTKNNLYPDIQEFVQKNIFGGQEKYGDMWMRGELTYKDINRIIATATNHSEEEVYNDLIISIKEFQINPIIIKFTVELKKIGIPYALVTSNMDIFNDFSVSYFHLDKYFPLIFNSADYKMLKRENNGKLYDIAIKAMRMDSYNNVLLIDDSEKSCELIKSKGGLAYQYLNDEDFINWLKLNLLIDLE
jgi:beta-phosphoglucomutase-like phosphatase (HAD superfamily)